MRKWIDWLVERVTQRHLRQWVADTERRLMLIEGRQAQAEKLLKGSLENLALISRDLSILRTQRELGIAPKRRPRRRH